MENFKKYKKVFYEDLTLYVHPDVYEPAEDSFALAKHLPSVAKGHILDMGTGSGILAIAARNEDSEVLGVDISPLAVENARFNAEQNGAECEFAEGDMFNGIEDEFDLIIFNPPYLPTGEGEETAGILSKAWSGGPSGRELIDRFLGEVPDFLTEKGAVLTLASSLSGIDPTMTMLKKKGFSVSVLEQVPLFHEKLAVILARKV